MYEPRNLPPAKGADFTRRLLGHFAAAAVLLAASLGVGIAGYCWFEGLPVIDAFLNSAMLLGGMGPVDPPKTVGGKLFAGLYALYAGLVFIVTAALLLTPVAHRMLHRFHWESGRDAGKG